MIFDTILILQTTKKPSRLYTPRVIVGVIGFEPKNTIFFIKSIKKGT